MRTESIGIIEINNISGSLKIMNLFTKMSNIKLLDKQFLGDGIVSIFIEGELGAIKNALKEGERISVDSNYFLSSHYIPMPHKDLFLKLNIGVESI